jgi:hypothetical protein
LVLSACVGPEDISTGGGSVPRLPPELVVQTDLTGAPAAVQQCGVLFKQANTCLTLNRGERVEAVGMEDGSSCTVVALGPSELGSADIGDGIAVLGEHLYFCGDDTLWSVDLRTGDVSSLGHTCSTVSAWKPNGLSLMRQPVGATALVGVEVDEGQATDVEPTVLVADLDRTVSRHAVDGDTLYAAWHSTDTIERYDLATGTWQEPLRLQGFDDWVLGIGIMNSGHLAVPQRISEPFHIFDLETGEDVTPWDGEIANLSAAGLVCDPYPAWQGID